MFMRLQKILGKEAAAKVKLCGLNCTHGEMRADIETHELG